MHAWARTVEELKLASLDQNTRVLGIVSPLPEAGVTELAGLMAETSHSAGARTLLADLAGGPDSSAHALAWQAWMTLIEEFGPATGLSVRAMRKSMQTALAGSRLTRRVVSGFALAASDMADLIVEHASATHVGLRVSVAGAVASLEIIHDGVPMPTEKLASLQGPVQAEGVIPVHDENLRFALARRTLPRWEYVEGPFHRLVGVCSLDGSPDPATVDHGQARAYDRLVANPAGSFRAPFNSVDHMRQLFRQELAHYQAVIVDLPPILGGDNRRINPLAPAAACDGIYLLCMAGIVDSDAIAMSMKLLRQSSVNVLGVVVNDARNPSLGSELAREARRLRRIAPGVSRWLARKALNARFLN